MAKSFESVHSWHKYTKSLTENLLPFLSGSVTDSHVITLSRLRDPNSFPAALHCSRVNGTEAFLSLSLLSVVFQVVIGAIGTWDCENCCPCHMGHWVRVDLSDHSPIYPPCNHNTRCIVLGIHHHHHQYQTLLSHHGHLPQDFPVSQPQSPLKQMTSALMLVSVAYIPNDLLASQLFIPEWLHKYLPVPFVPAISTAFSSYLFPPTPAMLSATFVHTQLSYMHLSTKLLVISLPGLSSFPSLLVFLSIPVFFSEINHETIAGKTHKHSYCSQTHHASKI